MKKRQAKTVTPVQARPGTVIQNCHFIGVKWDKPALNALQTVADALLNLTHLFRSQGLTAALIEVRGDEAKVNAHKTDE